MKAKSANKIAQDMRDRGGLISTQDLQNYRPVWRKPINGNFKEYEIVTMGTPIFWRNSYYSNVEHFRKL
jgi:gamma-glutamyltranspeptidase/glutathione hydrolase